MRGATGLLQSSSATSFRAFETRFRRLRLPASSAMARTALDELGASGAFERTPSSFRHQIEPGGRFPPEKGRYHLYISLACPWANRCLAALNLKGIGRDVVGVSVTHPTWQRTRPDVPGDTHCGWTFVAPGDPPLSSSTGHGSFECDSACVPDSVNGARYVRDLYDMAVANDPGLSGYSGKYTVPVLWDSVTRTIVNNESSEIVRLLNSQFNTWAARSQLDLYPAGLRDDIDEVNAWVYDDINNGVYKCGFASRQEPYEKAFGALFGALDRAEGILCSRQWLAGDGDHPTEADVRLFMTLIRFDEVYVVYFKTNKKFIRDYPALAAYVRRIYAYPGMAESINMSHIKVHYFTSHPQLNPYAIVPVGPGEWWKSDK